MSQRPSSVVTVSGNEIKGHLRQLEKRTHDGRHHLHTVTSRLEQGSLVSLYEIDNPEICSRLGYFADDDFPYWKIHGAFKGPCITALLLMESGGHTTGDGRKCLPFSKAFDYDFGECLERAILTQLIAQQAPYATDSFLVCGYERGQHAFNVVYMPEHPYLVDTMNPLREEGKAREPYIAPLTGIEVVVTSLYSNYPPLESDRFLVPPQWERGRSYKLDWSL
ncbi:MAG: hypothetical protein HYY37_01155 [Candidatus Aenigmarchaeota archaeon]|nr:hypothetical protein [Candidatus Aenigmarchaeota archaeon]